MPEDAVGVLSEAGVFVAVFRGDDPELLVAPSQLAQAAAALEATGWLAVPAGRSHGLPATFGFRHSAGRRVTLRTSLVDEPDLRRLFPIRTVDVLHRAGWWHRRVNPVSSLDDVLLACMRQTCNDDTRDLSRSVSEARAWSANERQAFSDTVRRAGAQLPVLVALDTVVGGLDTPIAPKYRMWRRLSLRSRHARRATRRSTFGSLANMAPMRSHLAPADRSNADLYVAVAAEAAAMHGNAAHSRWRALAALSPKEAVDAVQIVASLVKVDLLLRRHPFTEVVQRTGVSVDFGAPHTSHVVVLPGWAEEDARLVERLGRVLLPGNPCLRTSIVIAQRLRQFEPAVRIGVSGTSGRFSSAHAWVEVGGVSFGEDQRFAPFAEPAHS